MTTHSTFTIVNRFLSGTDNVIKDNIFQKTFEFDPPTNVAGKAGLLKVRQLYIKCDSNDRSGYAVTLNFPQPNHRGIFFGSTTGTTPLDPPLPSSGTRTVPLQTNSQIVAFGARYDSYFNCSEFMTIPIQVPAGKQDLIIQVLDPFTATSFSNVTGLNLMLSFEIVPLQ